MTFSANFQTIFIIFLAFFFKVSTRKKVYAKLKDWMSNNVDHYEPSHLDLRCLQKPFIIAYDSEKV